MFGPLFLMFSIVYKISGSDRFPIVIDKLVKKMLNCIIQKYYITTSASISKDFVIKNEFAIIKNHNMLYNHNTQQNDMSDRGCFS